MPQWVYHTFTVVTLLAVAGVIYLVMKKALTPFQRTSLILMSVSLLLLYLVVIQISLYQIAWQGRLIYPALSGIAILFAMGLLAPVLGRGALQPVLVEPRRYRLAGAISAAYVLALLIANLYSIVWVVYPALN